MTSEDVLVEWVALMANGASAEATAFRAVISELYPSPAPEDVTYPFATWSLISNVREEGALSGSVDCMIDRMTIQIDLWDDNPSPLRIVQARDLLFDLLEARKPALAHIQLFDGEQLIAEPEVGYHVAMTYDYLVGRDA